MSASTSGFHGLDPLTPAEFDDLLDEYRLDVKNRVSKSHFQTLVAALERVKPGLKHRLTWAHAALANNSRYCKPSHTAPMTSDVGVLLGHDICQRHEARVGSLLWLQCIVGLRPAEALGSMELIFFFLNTTLFLKAKALSCWVLRKAPSRADLKP